MMRSFRHAYIKVHSLDPDTLAHAASGYAVHWDLERGWLGQPIPIQKKRTADMGYEYTWGKCKLTSLSRDSYEKSDLSEWRDLQEERDPQPAWVQQAMSSLDAQIPVISSVE